MNSVLLDMGNATLLALVLILCLESELLMLPYLYNQWLMILS